MQRIVLHDYYESADGGGRLCRVLADSLRADLGYGFARRGHPFVRGGDGELDLRAHSALPLWRQFKLARAFEGLGPTLASYHTAIYSGFYAPLAALRRDRLNVLYCHTPPRFIYDQREFYLDRSPAPLRPLLRAFIAYLQPRYEAAARKMDLILTNSHNVRARIQRYLGLDSSVVYPPCDSGRFRWLGQGDYYLSTARLDPLKRVDILVQAFLQLPDRRLVVASGGAELNRLRHLARHAPNIEFTGWLDEASLADYVGRAIATLYLPRDEDFGMSPLESMAAGKPVLGVAEGGLLESVLPGRTGLLLPPAPTPRQVIAAVGELTPARALAMRADCEAQAAKFATEVFAAETRRALSRVEGGI